MCSLTDIQCMYINRVRDLFRLRNEYENMIDRKSSGITISEDVIDELLHDIHTLETEKDLLDFILGDDVPLDNPEGT